MAESESSQQPQLQQQQGVPVLLRSLKEQTPLSFLSSLLSITFDFVTGRYMSATYFVSHSAIREAYDLIALVAALLMGSGLAVFVAPVQSLPSWQARPSLLTFIGLTSGWTILCCLFVILSVVGVLSVVHLIPARRDNALLKSFVARNWTAFCAPLFMLNVAILSFIACILTVGIFIYSYNLAFGGFAWAGAVLLVLLRFQYTITHRTIKDARARGYAKQHTKSSVCWPAV